MEYHFRPLIYVCDISASLIHMLSNYLGHILQVKNVRLVDRSSSRRTQVGTLYLTATHTIFVGKGSEDRNELWVSDIFGMSFCGISVFKIYTALLIFFFISTVTDTLCSFFTGSSQFSV